MSTEFWLIYIATVFVASIIPGPSMLLALTCGMRFGSRKTLPAAMGNVTASMLQAGISIAGLGAVLTASETVFIGIKWCGAVYLIYTGISLIRAPAADIAAAPSSHPALQAAWRKRFMQAFWVAAGNPKAIVFFTALFPQFIQTGGMPWTQVTAMIVLLALVAFVCFMIYAMGGDRLITLLGRGRIAKWAQRVIGGSFIGLGLGIAVSRR